MNVESYCRCPGCGECAAHSRERKSKAEREELLRAVGELSMAMGSPAVGGKYPQTIESQTIRLAAERLRAAGKAA